MVECCRLRPCCRCHFCDCPAVRARAAACVAVVPPRSSHGVRVVHPKGLLLCVCFRVPQEAGGGHRLRPGDPGPGCHQTTTAPHCNPDGRPHRPRPIPLRRGGGRSKVSILDSGKRKPIKTEHLPAVGAVIHAERAVIASARQPPLPPPTPSPPQRGLLHTNGRRAGAAARGARRLPHDAGGASASASNGHDIVVPATEEGK